MFDEIIVPKSYLRNLLTKENEKLLHKDHVFQTKDFDNFLDVYKIYRQRLYKLDRSEVGLEEGTQHTKLTDKWDKVYGDKRLSFTIKSKTTKTTSIGLNLSSPSTTVS